MAALDCSECPAVESVPDRVDGAGVFKDTRLPVATVLSFFPSGMPTAEPIEPSPSDTDQAGVHRQTARREIEPIGCIR